jgi:hypothetical protein
MNRSNDTNSGPSDAGPIPVTGPAAGAGKAGPGQDSARHGFVNKRGKLTLYLFGTAFS